MSFYDVMYSAWQVVVDMYDDEYNDLTQYRNDVREYAHLAIAEDLHRIADAQERQADTLDDLLEAFQSFRIEARSRAPINPNP
jgi:ABC-type nitrate/sulfonate/bicarbonate transport system substrate-binding protein